MKRKVLFITFIVAVALIAFPAVALGAFTHGDFATNSKGCGDCHITHAGDAAKLLISASGGSTQTDVCYTCHDSTAGSPYDAKNGITKGADGTRRPSFAGGFSTAIDFQDGAVTSSTLNGPVVGVPAYFKPVTSVHSVELAANYDTEGSATKAIPGGSTVLGSLGFRCGSCHDPHAGGAYDPTAASWRQPRLLRLKDMPADVNVERAVYMTLDNTAGTRIPTAYGYAATNKPSGFNKWCGGCHDVFDTEYASAGANGHTKGSGTKYRHLVGVNLESGLNTKKLTDYSVLQVVGNDLAGVPLDSAGTNGKVLTCMSCHRAHGTSSPVDASVSFKRYSNYNGVATGTSTVLLREKDRDVCYNCHGAGQYNWSFTP